MTKQFSSRPGDLWRKSFYPFIRDSLELDEKADVSCRDLLHSLLKNENDDSDLGCIQKEIQSSSVIVFGAGPSLESDINGIKSYISHRCPTLVAADGAAEALRKAGVLPGIIVSDLDSCSVETMKLCGKKGYLFVHGHGDNAGLVRAIIPHLASHKLGTTQVETRDYIRNFGGFTDGDRACYVVSHFKPSTIVLAGMDFGEKEGRYSLDRYNSSRNTNRALKLDWGKKSLEFLISSHRSINFRNVTRFGAEIKGARRTDYLELT